MPSTRRALASAASLLAVFGSSGPFAGSAEAAPETGQPATIEDYAAQEYEAWPEDAGGELQSISTFLPRCAADYPVIGLALAVMKRTPHQNAQAAAALPDEMLEFAESLGDLSERYKQLGELLSAAQVRVMAGVAQHVIATGEEA